MISAFNIAKITLKQVSTSSCLYRAILGWNMLKPCYTVIEDLNQFKLAIKKGYGDCFM